MYTPAPFRIDDREEAHALMRAHPFALLVTLGAEGLVGTHLPTVLRVEEAPLGRIECHLARPNTQWQTFSGETDALMVFQGPEAYIRPSWYASKAEHGKVVPTWNYAAVHAYGRLEVVHDPTWLLRHVAQLTEQQEAPYPAPWGTGDAPPSYLAAMVRGIVGLKLSITRLEGKVKMSQNREARDRAGVVRGIADRAMGDDRRIAELVAKHKG
jgi:transcriptional regulator